jgi:hypothetical protein
LQVWLMLLYKVPSNPTARRVYVWRKLKRLGALLLHDAAWVLPATARTREQLQWLAAEIEEMGGEAHLWEATLAYGEKQSLIRQFLEQVESAYADLLAALQEPGADPGALVRRYQQIVSQDYFHSELGQQVRQALMQARGGETG